MKKVFNLNLGLYQIDVRGIGRVSQRVFWQEIEGKEWMPSLIAITFKVKIQVVN
jgi:hypothetical protein